MSRRLTVVLLAAVASLLLACGAENELTHGRVVDKEYDDEDTWWGSQCVAYAEDGFTCEFSVPVMHTDPAHYKLRIQGVDGQEDLKEWHSVDETGYHAVQVGDLWTK